MNHTLSLYNLLTQNFTAQELRILAYDYFLPIYDAGGHDKPEEFAWRLIDHADREKMLGLVKKHKRTAYEMYQVSQQENTQFKPQTVLVPRAKQAKIKALEQKLLMLEKEYDRINQTLNLTRDPDDQVKLEAKAAQKEQEMVLIETELNNLRA